MVIITLDVISYLLMHQFLRCFFFFFFFSSRRRHTRFSRDWSSDVCSSDLDAPADAWLGSPSVTYLRRTGQLDDLDFILRHMHDLSDVFQVQYGEVVTVVETAGAAA